MCFSPTSPSRGSSSSGCDGVTIPATPRGGASSPPTPSATPAATAPATFLEPCLAPCTCAAERRHALATAFGTLLRDSCRLEHLSARDWGLLTHAAPGLVVTVGRLVDLVGGPSKVRLSDCSRTAPHSHKHHQRDSGAQQRLLVQGHGAHALASSVCSV
jgi:hypothetical protein